MNYKKYSDLKEKEPNGMVEGNGLKGYNDNL